MLLLNDAILCFQFRPIAKLQIKVVLIDHIISSTLFQI